MKNGGPSLWNAIAICGTSKTSWRTGKLPMKDDSKSHSKDRSFHLEQWSNIIRFRQEIKTGVINTERKFYLGYALIAGENLERRYSDC